MWSEGSYHSQGYLSGGVVVYYQMVTVNFRLLVMDTSMHTQKPCSGGTIELNHIVYISTTNPLNTLLWLLCILAFSLTSNLKCTVLPELSGGYYQS